MDDAARVMVDVDGAVAHVRLNRPDKLNALDTAMFEGQPPHAPVDRPL
jgi:enoyl-CoA hydratase/carnithine racemase